MPSILPLRTAAVQRASPPALVGGSAALVAPALVTSVLALGVACSPAPAGPARALGTNVELHVPDGLAPVRAYSGFESADGSVSVRVTELHQALPDRERVLDAVLEQRLGNALRSREDVTVAGLPAVLARLEPGESTTSAAWTDWQLLVFGPEDTLDVRARFPRGDERWAGPLRAALLGLAWKPGMQHEVFEGPGFRIRPPPGFVHTTSAQGIYTFVAPADAAAPKSDRLLDPSVSVVVERGAIDAEFLDPELSLRLQARAGAKDWSVVQSTRLQLAGLPALEVLAHGRLDPGEREFFLVGVLVSGDEHTWWLHGEARLTAEAQELPRLRAALLSFERFTPEAAR
ncbi:MAG: hypothetical protein IPJ77_18860 [Planctomycetes bacterium]|nr:hypothetical protein [Planctomycetota bacterium]